MKNFVFVGTYSNAALKGFIDKPDQDRKAVVQKMSMSIGTKLLDFKITRGIYDFIAIAEGTSDQALSLKLAVLSTGAVGEMHILEEINLSGPASEAGKALGSYTTPH